MHNRPNRAAVLQNTTLPVLFIAGTEDIVAPINDVLAQASMPQQSFIHILENVGHMGMWEATDKVNEYLLQFINR